MSTSNSLPLWDVGIRNPDDYDVMSNLCITFKRLGFAPHGLDILEERHVVYQAHRAKACFCFWPVDPNDIAAVGAEYGIY